MFNKVNVKEFQILMKSTISKVMEENIFCMFFRFLELTYIIRYYVAKNSRRQGYSGGFRGMGQNPPPCSSFFSTPEQQMIHPSRILFGTYLLPTESSISSLKLTWINKYSRIRRVCHISLLTRYIWWMFYCYMHQVLHGI